MFIRKCHTLLVLLQHWVQSPPHPKSIDTRFRLAPSKKKGGMKSPWEFRAKNYPSLATVKIRPKAQACRTRMVCECIRKPSPVSCLDCKKADPGWDQMGPRMSLDAYRKSNLAPKFWHVDRTFSISLKAKSNFDGEIDIFDGSLVARHRNRKWVRSPHL